MSFRVAGGLLQDTTNASTGVRTITLDKNDVKNLFNSGKNIAYKASTGEISTVLNPTFNKITITDSPSELNDAVTVQYVNDKLQGLDVKESVRLATTDNIDLSGVQTVDNYTVYNGDRILVKDQTDAKDNGIYIANTSGAWTRAADFDAPDEVKGAFVFVEEGDVNSTKGFVQTNNNLATVGQGDIDFTQFNGTYAVTAGNGLTKDGNTLNVDTTLNFVTEMTGLTKIGTIESTVSVGGELKVNGGANINGVNVLNTINNIKTDLNEKLDSNATEFGGNAGTASAAKEGSALADALDSKAPINNPTFTGTVGGIDKTMVGLENVDNTADTAKPVSTAQQTALNLKANLASPTFTGTVGGIDKTMVGLENVDNTADTAKPVSTDQQTALDLKAPINNPTFTGTLTASSIVLNTSITIDTTLSSSQTAVINGTDLTITIDATAAATQGTVITLLGNGTDTYTLSDNNGVTATISANSSTIIITTGTNAGDIVAYSNGTLVIFA